MSQNSFPDNVPDATKGASDSVAAPGCVGVGGTSKERLLLALSVFLGLPAFLALNAYLYSLSDFWYFAGFVGLAWFALCWFIAGVVTGAVGPRV